MPSDITGTDILQDDPETGRRRFAFIHGPVFANIILADEINRTPPKTQAALLEAMQERHVTAGGRTYHAARPVLRAGHAEPDRAGGDLPAARGPARPLHAQRPGAVPDARRGAGDPPRHHRRAAPAPRGDRSRPSRSWRCSTWSAGCRWPITSSRYARDLVRASRPDEPEATDARQAVRLLGRRPPGRPGADPVRQGPRRAARPVRGGRRRRPRRRPPGAAPPDRHHLPRRGRGDRHRRASSTTCSRPSPPRPNAPPGGWWGREGHEPSPSRLRNSSSSRRRRSFSAPRRSAFSELSRRVISSL